jgi:pectinacetylesterase
MKFDGRFLLLPSLALVACGSAGTSATSDGGHESGTTSDAGSGHDASGKPTKDAGQDGAVSTGGDSGIPKGTPITATAGTWTWVPFPDAECANGTPTGIGVNLSSTPNARVLIYLEGGGACWSDLTCYTVMSASYFTTGYDEATFTAESASELAVPGGFFDRTTSANPFQDYNYVYLPYCTGDVFGGNNVVKFPSGTAHFVGYANVGAFLSRIVPTFPDADRVILAGSSAGGFGAALNWWRTQQAFGSIRVDLIDDSGTVMPDSVLGDAGVSLEQTWGTTWNLLAALPPGCTTCKADLSTMYGFYEKEFATHRAALLSYEQDTVLPTFFGITTAQFTAGLNQDIGTYFGPTSSLKYFTNAGAGHVLWFTPTLTSGTGTTTVQEFITQMVTDDPSWASVHP